MNVDKVIHELKVKYPGKNVFPNSIDKSGEVVCEIEPTSEHPEYSKAIAVIDKSLSHFHFQATETYKILKGSLTLHVNHEQHVLNEGDTFVIEPKKIHWAEGKEVWVECYSEPGWNPDDHIYTIVRKEKKQ